MSQHLSADTVARFLIAASRVTGVDPERVFLAGGGAARIAAAVSMVRALSVHRAVATKVCGVSHPNQLSPSQWAKGKVTEATISATLRAMAFEPTTPPEPPARVERAPPSVPRIAAAVTQEPPRTPPAAKPYTAETFQPEEIGSAPVGPCSLMNLRRDRCHWPVGEANPIQMYCNDPTAGGEYCADHGSAMFASHRPRKPTDTRGADLAAERARERRAM